MESGGQQSNSEIDNKREPESSSPSELTSATLAKISTRSRHRLHPKTKVSLFDNTARGYGWLLPGWVAEERYMEHGRVYRVKHFEFMIEADVTSHEYYYDPDGKLYKTQQEVLHFYEQKGLVVIDK